MGNRIDSIGDAIIFSTVEANSDYWQIEVSRDDYEKKKFISNHSLYQFHSMFSGLQNASATFQRVIDVMMSTDKLYYPLVHLNDIVIFSCTSEEHIK